MRNKVFIRIALFIGTVISWYFVPGPIVNAWITPLPETVQEQVNRATDYGFDGIVMYGNEKGQQPEFYGAGYKKRESKIPADPHSLFNITSVGKLHTAVAVTKLVYDGRLSLNKTLAESFPELPGRIENARKITVRMMVQHRRGISNYTDTKNYWVHPKPNDKEQLGLGLFTCPLLEFIRNNVW